MEDKKGLFTIEWE